MSHFFRFVFYVRFTVFTLVLVPPYIVLALFRFEAANKLPMLWHRSMLRGMSVRLSTVGDVDPRRPLLLIANHAS